MTARVGGALQVTDDGRILRVEHAHVGAAPAWRRQVARTTVARGPSSSGGELAPDPVRDAIDRAQREARAAQDAHDRSVAKLVASRRGLSATHQQEAQPWEKAPQTTQGGRTQGRGTPTPVPGGARLAPSSSKSSRSSSTSSGSSVGGANDPNAERQRITGNAAGSSISNDAGSMLVPTHMLEHGQRVRFPSIIGGHSAIVGTHAAIVGCSCVPRSELSSAQIGAIGDFWADAAPHARIFDDVASGVMTTIAPVVPGGAFLEAANQARRGAMYGTPGARGDSERAIVAAQDLTRRARKGDPTAQAQIIQIKEAAAANDANAIRTWRVIVLVSRDDDARIADSTQPVTPTATGGGLGSLLQGGGGGGLFSSFGGGR